MIFTTQENQKKIVSLMEAVDDMHRRTDMPLSQADQVEIAVALMIKHLLANYDNNVVMSYDLANKLTRLDNSRYRQQVVRILPYDTVITRAWIAHEQSSVFYVMHRDSSTVIYNDFRAMLENEGIISWASYEYIRAMFSMNCRWINTYIRAQSWSKNISRNSWLDYYGDHDFIFGKLEPAVSKFIDNVDSVTLQDVMQLLESLN